MECCAWAVAAEGEAGASWHAGLETAIVNLPGGEEHGVAAGAGEMEGRVASGICDVDVGSGGEAEDGVEIFVPHGAVER